MCFIADDTLEQLPTASRVGKTRVGGIDFNRPRMRATAHAVIALATAPKGFTASPLAEKVATLSSLPASRYGPRHAAYDLKKLRGKKLVEKIGSSHRYQPTRQGLRAMTALLVLRDKVIKPLLAGSCQLNWAEARQHHAPRSTLPATPGWLARPLSAKWASPHEKHRQLFLHVGSLSA
jgi:hypothetical protein